MEYNFKLTPQQAREEWIKALRNGEYKQGKSVLCNVSDNSYCCLGVACELFRKLEGEDRLPVMDMTSVRVEDGEKKEYKVRYYDHSDNGCAAYLPVIVQKWLGMGHETGRYHDPSDGDVNLAWVNDEQERTFEEIADIIASNPKGLFNDG